MEGTYPVLIEGRERGRLTVTKQGLMTVFEAECEDAGGVLRLSVYGEREGYLGVMVPDEDGALRLKKSLSRSALMPFPKKISHAAKSGMAIEEARPETKEKIQSFGIVYEEEPPEEVETPEIIEEPFDLQEESKSEPESEATAELELPKAEGGDIIWQRGADGALASTDVEGIRRIAVPAREGAKPIGRSYELKTIEGAEYIVFEVKNGKIN